MITTDHAFGFVLAAAMRSEIQHRFAYRRWYRQQMRRGWVTWADLASENEIELRALVGVYLRARRGWKEWK